MKNIHFAHVLILAFFHQAQSIPSYEDIADADTDTPQSSASLDSSLLSSTAVVFSPESDKVLVDADEYDERTLLDTFGEAAKQFLTQKVIPETDPECKWDWRYVRCEPFCDCAFLPKSGDYHLGRSCRRDEKPGCNATTTPRPTANSIQLVIQRLVQGSQLAINAAKKKTKQGYNKLQTSVCDNLPEMDCDKGIPMLAWQERALCRHKIPTCPEVSFSTDSQMVYNPQESLSLQENAQDVIYDNSHESNKDFLQ